MKSITVNRRHRSVALALTLAWLGILYHDLREFGRPAIENSIVMGMIAVLLFSLWRRLTEHRGQIVFLMMAYAIISLVGALTSVLPLEVWPFEPEQSFEHYFSHGIWAIAVLPLIWEMITFVREERQKKRS